MANKTKKNIQPLGDRLLIKPLEAKGEAKTASGIILPGKDKDEGYERGEVIATGPGRVSAEGKRVALDVKKGDVVWYKRGYDSQDVEIGGEEMILTSEGNVLAIER
jgi:chaperonin GroES